VEKLKFFLMFVLKQFITDHYKIVRVRGYILVKKNFIQKEILKIKLQNTTIQLELIFI
jgi:hypothetical protein